MNRATLSLSHSAEYQLKRLLGFGRRSVSFLARRVSSGVAQTVVFKAYWDRAPALREMEGLAAANAIPGVPALLAAGSVPRAALIRAARPVLALKDLRGLNATPPETPVAVMEWVRAEPLVQPLLETATAAGWPIEAGGRLWREGWRYERRPEESLALFTRLAEIVEACHGLRPPKVHGDLSPLNVLHHPGTAQVFVVDYLKLDPVGTPGWDSPWHGEGAALTPAADVFSLLLWGLRLLEPAATPELTAMLAACAVDDPGEVEITALDLLEFCVTR